MTDIMDKASRSRLMSGIRGKNTKIEIQIRKALFARGFRYRLHVKDLPGKPDIVLPRYKALIFIHGCFWHGHDCHIFRLPASNIDFWQSKIEKNKKRDILVQSQLIELGWKLATVWECAIRGREKIGAEETVNRLDNWLRTINTNIVIKGKNEQ
ncbi:MAG: DNA mismatch endonuclease Vsr [Advenella sp.]